MKLENIRIAPRSKCFKCQKEITEDMLLELDATWRNPVVIRHQDCENPYGKKEEVDKLTVDMIPKGTKIPLTVEEDKDGKPESTKKRVKTKQKP